MLLFIDDATSEILAAEFVDHDSFWSYAALCKRYFHQYWLPEAFYMNRFSVFQVNYQNVTTTAALTMFEHAMSKLGIELICAASPQAKGCVWNVPIKHYKIVWSKKCAWRGSATINKRMLS